MTDSKSRPKYVLITPARNEQAYIEQTIRSVIAQTVKPEKWIIVSDGSTDRTEEIVRGYLKKYAWMELVRLPEKRDRTFAAKVSSFNAGYERIKNVRSDIIGNLDADISFDKDYFEFLLGRFAQDPGLGVAGTPFREENGYNTMVDSFEGGRHVAGGCQLFRRECFQEIGGYVPVKGGGIDWIAVTTARMRGWKTMSFPEKYFFHHRGLGTAQRNTLGASFDYGRKDYYLGGHPLWQLVRVAYRMTKRPYVLGGLALFGGYFSGMLARVERPVSDELMRFHRREQMQRLRMMIRSVLTMKKIEKYSVSPDGQGKQ
jgi:glycosyltransferase involved in cell wall biosynthesis